MSSGDGLNPFFPREMATRTARRAAGWRVCRNGFAFVLKSTREEHFGVTCEFFPFLKVAIIIAKVATIN